MSRLKIDISTRILGAFFGAAVLALTLSGCGSPASVKAEHGDAPAFVYNEAAYRADLASMGFDNPDMTRLHSLILGECDNDADEMELMIATDRDQEAGDNDDAWNVTDDMQRLHFSNVCPDKLPNLEKAITFMDEAAAEYDDNMN